MSNQNKVVYHWCAHFLDKRNSPNTHSSGVLEEFPIVSTEDLTRFRNRVRETLLIKYPHQSDSIFVMKSVSRLTPEIEAETHVYQYFISHSYIGGTVVAISAGNYTIKPIKSIADYEENLDTIRKSILAENPEFASFKPFIESFNLL